MDDLRVPPFMETLICPKISDSPGDFGRSAGHDCVMEWLNYESLEVTTLSLVDKTSIFQTAMSENGYLKIQWLFIMLPIKMALNGTVGRCLPHSDTHFYQFENAHLESEWAKTLIPFPLNDNTLAFNRNGGCVYHDGPSWGRASGARGEGITYCSCDFICIGELQWFVNIFKHHVCRWFLNFYH